MNFAARTTHSKYRCSSCGHVPERWSPRCPRCQGWIVQTGDAPQTPAPPRRPTSSPIRDVEPPVPRPRPATESTIRAVTDDEEPRPEIPKSDLVPLTEIAMVKHARILSTLEPLDRVTGGGLVQSGSFLISGDPGAGKSTLLSQLLYLARRPDGTSCERLMWATAEEGPEHIAMRAQRLGTAHPKIRVTREEDVDQILAHASRLQPEILVVDSIQTVSTTNINSAVGSVLQVKECAIRCDRFAKSTGACVFLICQVTKDGQAAGPNTLKHLVDVLLSLDTSDEFPALRFLRTSKNRFGSTTEVGYFEMGNDGLRPVMKPEDSERDGAAPRDEFLPVAQELVHLLLEAGGTIGADLRNRIAGRLDLNPRGSR